MLIIREPHYSLKNVCLNKIYISVFQTQRIGYSWQSFSCVHVYGCFIIYAALKFSALACKFLGIQRKVLASCRCCSNRLEIIHISRTAKRLSADSYSSNQSRFLSCANLLHLYSDMKFFCKTFNQLSELYALIC